MDGYVILACVISFYIGFLIGKNKEFCKTKIMPFKEIYYAVNNDVNEENINVDGSSDDSDDIKNI